MLGEMQGHRPDQIKKHNHAEGQPHALKNEQQPTWQYVAMPSKSHILRLRLRLRLSRDTAEKLYMNP